MPSGRRPTSRPGASPGRGKPRTRTHAPKSSLRTSAAENAGTADASAAPRRRSYILTARAIALSVALLILTISYATSLRIYFAQARDGLFFRRFATIHPRFQTPHLAILMFGAWSALLAITGTYETLAAYAMFAAWVFYGMTSLGVIVLRRTQPQRARPYLLTGYPVTLLVFVVVALAFVVNTFIATPGPAMVGTLLIAAGVPVYFIWKRNG